VYWRAVSDRAYEIDRVPGARLDDAVGSPAERSLPRTSDRATAGGLRPSSVPVVDAAENRGAPEPDEERDRSSNGSGSGSGSSAPPPPPPASRSASLTLSGNTYTDTAAESHKNITFNATWSGGTKEDYVIVQWLKGYSKNADGTPRTVTMYGSDVDFNFANWQIDSIDADPAYWSDAGGRWNYSVDAANKFSATDDPGPVKSAQGAGREAKVDFKTAVYKAADVPATTKGTISATPLSSFQPWSYNVRVESGGKYKH